MLAVAEALDVKEPRDFTLRDATVAAAIMHGIESELSVEETLLRLVLLLAEQKRELQEALLKELTGSARPIMFKV